MPHLVQLAGAGEVYAFRIAARKGMLVGEITINVNGTRRPIKGLKGLRKTVKMALYKGRSLAPRPSDEDIPTPFFLTIATNSDSTRSLKLFIDAQENFANVCLLSGLTHINR